MHTKLYTWNFRELDHNSAQIALDGHVVTTFVKLPEGHYQKLVRGLKLVRPRPREMILLEQISKLYDLVKQSLKLEDRSLNSGYRQANLLA